MKSNTKVLLEPQAVAALCAAAGFPDAARVQSLGAGEFNAVYAFDSGGERYALKIAPDSRQPVMTYEKNMMRSEVFWYGQLRKHTGIRTPEVVRTDFSRTLLPSNFYIMRYVGGKQMNEMDFSPAERADAVKMLPQMAAQIHRIRHNGFGYPQCGYFKTWDLALEAMAGSIVRDAAAMGKPCENGERMLSLIRAHRAVLEQAPCRMVNFDLWESNILCERTAEGIRYAWIDPERGFWGDPVMDFICFEFDKPLAGKQNSLLAYNQIAGRLLVPDRETEIRYAFAQAYLGIIMEVEKYYRYEPGDEGWSRNEQVCGFLFGSAFGKLKGA